MMDIEVLSTKNRSLAKLQVAPTDTVRSIKLQVAKRNKSLYVERQSLRTEIRGKDNKDSLTVSELNLRNGAQIYVKDLGPQISWKLVFLLEYAGPLSIYLFFATRPWIFYGSDAADQPLTLTARIAAACWSAHYIKRLLETMFVHRFSHTTMPFFNLFKNCGYYWGFTAYVAYHVNHPLYTPPLFIQTLAGLALFTVCETGNLFTHLLLRNLRPPGTNLRRIPVPNGNIFNILFDYVSCPNYFYEFGAQIGFSILTSCLPALIFSFAGMYQMTLWALGKHRAYKREFKDYPKNRTAIVPFVI